MNTAEHIEHLERESHAFGRMSVDADMTAVVPSCPGWTVADLVWHLTEVQHFWGAIADGLFTDPDQVEEADRVDDGLLPIAHQSASHRLIEALRRHDPASQCWSWARGGGSIAWVARRQHHEAAIHRSDMELARGRAPTIDSVSALDGIDELIDVMLDGFPEWGEFVPGPILELDPSGAASRLVEVGRFVGTSPSSGTEYDDPAVRRVAAGNPTTVVRGDASAIDLWMWGRGPLDALSVEGDVELVHRLRQAVEADTQ